MADQGAVEKDDNSEAESIKNDLRSRISTKSEETTDKTVEEISKNTEMKKAEESLANPGEDSVVSFKKIHNIKVNVQAILGSLSLSVSRLANLKEGEMLELDTCVGEAIEIRANGHLIARGEILVVEGDASRFGITITEVLDANLKS